MIQNVAIKVSERSIATMAGTLSASTVAGIAMKLLNFNARGQSCYILNINGHPLNGDVKIITSYDLRRLYSYDRAVDDCWFPIQRRS